MTFLYHIFFFAIIFHFIKIYILFIVFMKITTKMIHNIAFEVMRPYYCLIFIRKDDIDVSKSWKKIDICDNNYTFKMLLNLTKTISLVMCLIIFQKCQNRKHKSHYSIIRNLQEEGHTLTPGVRNILANFTLQLLSFQPHPLTSM